MPVSASREAIAAEPLCWAEAPAGSVAAEAAASAPLLTAEGLVPLGALAQPDQGVRAALHRESSLAAAGPASASATPQPGPCRRGHLSSAAVPASEDRREAPEKSCCCHGCCAPTSRCGAVSTFPIC